MAGISVKITGLQEVRESLMPLFKEQLPFAMAVSLTKTAQGVQVRLIDEMKTVFDRPTPYTLGALYVGNASVTKQESSVYMKESSGKGTPPYKFLTPQIEGGERRVKRFEKALRAKGILPQDMYVVPGNYCNLDAYGNMSPGQIVQILSYFQTFGAQGYRANMGEKRIKKLAAGTKTQSGFTYFVQPTWHRGLAPGIYKRLSNRWDAPVFSIMIFVRKPHYKMRFKFFDVGQAKANDVWRPIFDAALAEVMSKAK
ncbi:MAG: hypothetical protein ABSB79_02755 [Syntrophales bacterium]|jgi:hypothetical protein